MENLSYVKQLTLLLFLRFQTILGIINGIFKTLLLFLIFQTILGIINDIFNGQERTQAIDIGPIGQISKYSWNLQWSEVQHAFQG